MHPWLVERPRHMTVWIELHWSRTINFDSSVHMQNNRIGHNNNNRKFTRNNRYLYIYIDIHIQNPGDGVLHARQTIKLSLCSNLNAIIHSAHIPYIFVWSNVCGPLDSDCYWNQFKMQQIADRHSANNQSHANVKNIPSAMKTDTECVCNTHDKQSATVECINTKKKWWNLATPQTIVHARVCCGVWCIFCDGMDIGGHIQKTTCLQFMWYLYCDAMWYNNIRVWQQCRSP